MWQGGGLYIGGSLYAIGDKMKVELVVDGNRIPLNRFVQKILGSGVAGMVETLDSVETPWRIIELKVEKGEEDA